VIPAAGLGTRLLSATKEQPKEMLPLFASSRDGRPTLKPLLQLVFEQLYDVGFREFYFIVGRGKRIIEDHFTQDLSYLASLEGRGKNEHVANLSDFYKRLDDSNLLWINQPSCLGFGDAVLKAKAAIGGDDFLVHAGDTYMLSNDNNHLRRLLEFFAAKKPEAAFIVKRMLDVKARGVIQGREASEGLYSVDKVVEKPDYPISNLAIEPIYLFRPSIFEALEKTQPGKGGEIQLTDAIQIIIDSGREVVAWRLPDSYLRLDIGDPQSYWQALLSSHTHVSQSHDVTAQ
jgi:UTP--glucose-1-phosphate uridylyltransferase